jgi:hypothetical protein
MFKIDWEHFQRREGERDRVRAEIYPLVDAIADAETKMKGLGVIAGAQRLRLAQARTELLAIVKEIEEAGNTLSESNMRSARKAAEMIETQYGSGSAQ